MLRREHPYYMFEAIQDVPDCLDGCLSKEIFQSIRAFTYQAEIKRVYLVGCGTSYHACRIGAAEFWRWLNIPALAMDGLTFQYHPPGDIDAQTLFISISHSGQSITTCESQAYALQKGARCLSITGNPESRLTKEANLGIVDPFGKEIPFGKTRSFISSVLLTILVVVSFQSINQQIRFRNEAEITLQIIRQSTESWINQIQKVARDWAGKIDRYLVAGFDVLELVTHEIALKCMEVLGESAAGFSLEGLAHGPCDSLRGNVGVIVFQTDPIVLFRTEQITSGIGETESSLLVISSNENNIWSDKSNHIKIPEISDFQILDMFSCTIIAQYLIYFLALEKGYNPDVNGLDRYPTRMMEFLFPPGTH